ncbi:helix-turn-helix domain-containing protein [Christensenellaceae bacterium OttesenSCG-928-M15]|nr:helix-turn-helix domain-containing protein [Christensenellaceae bacterium OttesenSCG-928-M15]
MTTQQAAERWELSDRRVRRLCAEGKIDGAKKNGKSYEIPVNAKRPEDGRLRNIEDMPPKDIAGYLKWENDVVGFVNRTINTVNFTQPDYNEVVSLYTHGQRRWSAEQYTEFLSERVVSRDRRDIERILFRCGLSQYDVLRIAEITRGMHPKDLLWIARDKDETLESAMTDVFSSVFLQHIDMTGDSIDTPEGYNIKRYGVFEGQYGIYKQRINPLVTDVESEIAVYLLAQKLGVPCCPAIRADQDTVFSVFLYDFSKEYIVHFRRLFDGARSDNEYKNLLSVRPQYRDEIARMILLDFITRQDDRHLSNIAIMTRGKEESFYPLYDNGRSLFYEDTEEMVQRAVNDPAAYATSFGYAGTYWDYVQEIAKERSDLKTLVHLDITEGEIQQILLSAGFQGYRLEGAAAWILKAIGMVRGV